MALESFGTEMAKMLDSAVTACHDMVLDQMHYSEYLPEKVLFRAQQEGMWAVYPSMLDGKPAVEIRIAVG